MTDIALADAQVVWTPMNDKSGPPIKVVGGKVKDDDDYISSFGVCDGDFQEADETKKLLMLMSQTVHWTLNEKIPVEEVHKALMVIPEYREAMIQAAVIPDPDN